MQIVIKAYANSILVNRQIAVGETRSDCWNEAAEKLGSMFVDMHQRVPNMAALVFEMAVLSPEQEVGLD